MRVCIQRVAHASCTVDNQITGKIERGYLVLVGFKNEDTPEIIQKMADKICHLRINRDENDKMNLSVMDINGSILSISQFTLYANCVKGRRPSFDGSANGATAEPMYHLFNEKLRELGMHVEEGIFGADMKIELLNDGPVTIWLDSDEVFK